MAAKSRMEKYRDKIVDLLNRGASIRSAWKITNSYLPDEAKISYNAFNHYINKNIKLDLL